MKITYDPVKRDATLYHRGLDMAQAGEVFAGSHITVQDIRFDYNEARFVTVGRLGDRMVVLAWTRRTGSTRIMSMRKANEREQRKYGKDLGRS
jgi:uncharacterized protein